MTRFSLSCGWPLDTSSLSIKTQVNTERQESSDRFLKFCSDKQLLSHTVWFSSQVKARVVCFPSSLALHVNHIGAGAWFSRWGRSILVIFSRLSSAQSVSEAKELCGILLRASVPEVPCMWWTLGPHLPLPFTLSLQQLVLSPFWSSWCLTPLRMQLGRKIFSSLFLVPLYLQFVFFIFPAPGTSCSFLFLLLPEEKNRLEI